MASVTRKVAHSTLFQFVGKITSTVLALVFIALITRHLGVIGYGQYFTIMVFVGIFSVVADLGLYIYVVNEISRERNDRSPDYIMSNVFTLRLITAAILLALAPVIALLFPYEHSILVGIGIAIFAMFFISANQVLIGVFQREFDTKKVAIGEVIGRILQVAFVGIVIFMDWGLYAVLIATVIGAFANFIYVFMSARKFVKIKLYFDFPFWKEIMSVTWPIAVSVVLNMIYFKVDTIFLSVMKGDFEVGLYGEAYKILEVLIAFPAIFAGLITPLLARYAYKNSEKFKTVIQKGFDTMFMFAIPIVFGGVMLSKEIVVFIGGPEFIGSAPILNLLVIAVASIFIGNMFANAVVALNKQRQMVWAYLSVAILAVVLDWLLIPKFSYMGAAWATVATELMIMALSIFVVYRASKTLPSIKNIWKVLLSAGVMAFAIYIFPNWNFLISLVLASVIYLVVLYGLGGLKKELIREVISRNNP